MSRAKIEAQKSRIANAWHAAAEAGATAMSIAAHVSSETKQAMLKKAQEIADILKRDDERYHIQERDVESTYGYATGQYALRRACFRTMGGPWDGSDSILQAFDTAFCKVMDLAWAEPVED